MYEQGKGLGADGSAETSKCSLEKREIKKLGTKKEGKNLICYFIEKQHIFRKCFA